MTKRERKYLSNQPMWLRGNRKKKLNARNPYKLMLKMVYEAKQQKSQQIFWAINWDSDTGIITARYSEPITTITIPLTR